MVDAPCRRCSRHVETYVGLDGRRLTEHTTRHGTRCQNSHAKVKA